MDSGAGIGVTMRRCLVSTCPTFFGTNVNSRAITGGSSRPTGIILSMARVRTAATMLMLLLSIGAFAQNQQAVPAAAKSGYLGSNVCKVCHPNVWANFYKNPHFKSLASGKEPPGKTGCEGCHGPAKDHVEAGGGRATIPNAFTLMSPTAVVDKCLDCHARDFSKANIRRSEHTLNEVPCTSCHSIHHSP